MRGRLISLIIVGLRVKFWEIVGLDFDDVCGGLDFVVLFFVVRLF